MPLPPNTPELANLDLFTSVIALGSVSKAAAAHGIAQPSASARIKSLERRLGVDLLERSPTGSSPTPAGSLVAGWAEGVLQAAGALTAGVNALQARRTGRLRIAASYTIAEYLLPAMLEQFLRNRPEDSVELDVANSTVVLSRVNAGQIDLGFVESPGSTPDFDQQMITTDELVAVVGRNHAWSRLGTVPIEALVSTPLIVREQGSGTREAFERAVNELGLDAPMTALEIGSTAAVRAAVLAGQHPAVMSRLAIGADIDAGSLVEVDVPELRVARELRAVWPSGAELPPLAAAFLQHLSQAA